MLYLLFKVLMCLSTLLSVSDKCKYTTGISVLTSFGWVAERSVFYKEKKHSGQWTLLGSATFPEGDVKTLSSCDWIYEVNSKNQRKQSKEVLFCHILYLLSPILSLVWFMFTGMTLVPALAVFCLSFIQRYFPETHTKQHQGRIIATEQHTCVQHLLGQQEVYSS